MNSRSDKTRETVVRPPQSESSQTTSGKKLRLWNHLPYFFPIIFLVLFFFFPIYSVLRTGLTENGGYTTKHVMDILNNPRYRRVITFTIKQAFYSELATILLGLPAAYLLSKHTFPGKSFVRALINQPTLLLADEPTGSLDGETSDVLTDLLLELNKESDTSLIVVTHSMQLAKKMDKLMHLRNNNLQIN